MLASNRSMSLRKHRTIRFHRQRLDPRVAREIAEILNAEVKPRRRSIMYATIAEAFAAARKKK